MIPNEDFTEPLGSIRASLATYRRNRYGGMEMVVVVDEDDKHLALDLVDGGELMVKLEVFGVPRA